jgi:hypothetical protein
MILSSNFNHIFIFFEIILIVLNFSESINLECYFFAYLILIWLKKNLSVMYFILFNMDLIEFCLIHLKFHTSIFWIHSYYLFFRSLQKIYVLSDLVYLIYFMCFLYFSFILCYFILFYFLNSKTSKRLFFKSHTFILFDFDR